MSTPDDPERIRLLDVYTRQIEQSGKLDLILKVLEAIPDHENRLRSLEKWKYGLPLATLLALASLAIGAYGWLHK